MAGFFFALVPLFIILIVSLIVPIIIVLRWQNRPVWALTIATSVFMFPIILLTILTMIGGYTTAQGRSLLLSALALFAIWMIIGLIFLVPIQWQSRKLKKRRIQNSIDQTF